MRRAAVTFLLIGCLALVGAQLAGTHAHIDSHGFDGAVQSSHDHHHGHGDGHDGDIDVSVVDFGLGTSKLVFLVIAACLTLFLLARTQARVPFERESPVPIRRRQRWRPPLRAPPR